MGILYHKSEYQTKDYFRLGFVYSFNIPQALLMGFNSIANVKSVLLPSYIITYKRYIQTLKIIAG